MNITKTIIMPATPLRAAVLLGSILSLAGSAQGALYWNDSVEGAVEDTDPDGPGGANGTPGVTQFTTQTFTASGSRGTGSGHTVDDLALITLNFNGMTVDGGEGLESMTGNLEDFNSLGDPDGPDRIVFQNVDAYTSGQVLQFNFSWANEMTSDKTAAGNGGSFPINGSDSYSGNGASDFGGWANYRGMLQWDNVASSLAYSTIVWDLYGDRVGLATDDFTDGQLASDPLAPSVATGDDDHAQFSYTMAAFDTQIVLADNENSAGSIDDWAVGSFSVTLTLADDVAAGSRFIFTFDGISNGIEVQTEVVPEPSGYLLLALGSLGLIARRKRRS